MSGDIFLQRGPDELVPMREAAYDSEEVLQKLLAKFPHLLAGDQLAGDESRRWVLIEREASVPDDEDAGGRWSLDHLFLDQDAVPTLVEVKRSSDTRIRREVVGQLIDYAANGVVYWPTEKLRASFEDRLEREGLDADVELAPVLGQEGDADTYWDQAGANLRAGRIRLVFVADEIPPELRRVVEFLNEQMDAEVIAIEVRQYLGPDGLRTLVPRVIGQTAAAETRKGEKRQWDEPSFFKELDERRGAEVVRVARELVGWARDHQLRDWWGRGKKTGSFIPGLDHGGREYWPFALMTNGKAEIKFGYMAKSPPFDDVELRRELLRRLNEIAGVSLPEDAVTRFPSIELDPLAASPQALDSFKGAMDWFCETVRSDAQDHAEG